MTKGELIKLLIDDEHTMDTEISIVAEMPHKDEYGKECSGYCFHIKGLDGYGDIVIDADWLLKKDKGEIMKGKDYLSQYCQDHNGEEIYEFLKNLFDRSLGYTDSRLSIVDWLDKDMNKGEEE